MQELADKRVLVIGHGSSGRAAGDLLRRRGARVLAIDSEDTPRLRHESEALRESGVEVRLGVKEPPTDILDLIVLSPGVPSRSALVQRLVRRNIPVIGELELGYQQSLCLNISIAGTNGKTTTTELVERILKHAHRKTVAAGNIGLPVCAVADQTRDLDFLTLEVSSFQLETSQFFRPVVAVLLNITPDHLDRYPSMADYTRAKARLFMNQLAFDWAIVQSEALAQLRSLNLEIPSKVITFSANNHHADIYLDRGLLVSRLSDWTGPLLDMDKCKLRGPHNAENLMAALAVGHVLRIPLDEMAEALRTYEPAPHRCEVVAEIGGVRFVNDSKATNVEALQKALLAMPVGKAGEPNVLLIAGGQDKGFEFHDLGPLLSQRVKQAFVLGETRDKIRAAWSLFTPCTVVSSLLEAVQQSAANAVPGDVVLLSPACSSFDMFQNYQHRGAVFRQAVEHLNQSARHGAAGGSPGAGGRETRPVQRAEQKLLEK